MVHVIHLFHYPAWLLQNVIFWKITNYLKLHPILHLQPQVSGQIRKIRTASRTWCLAVELRNALRYITRKTKKKTHIHLGYTTMHTCAVLPQNPANYFTIYQNTAWEPEFKSQNEHKEDNLGSLPSTGQRQKDPCGLLANKKLSF